MSLVVTGIFFTCIIIGDLWALSPQLVTGSDSVNSKKESQVKPASGGQHSFEEFPIIGVGTRGIVAGGYKNGRKFAIKIANSCWENEAVLWEYKVLLFLNRMAGAYPYLNLAKFIPRLGKDFSIKNGEESSGDSYNVKLPTIGQGINFFPMEFIRGDSLNELLSANRIKTSILSTKDKLDIVISIFEFLDVLEKIGVIHDNLTTSNIICSKSAAGVWVLKVIAFGKAMVDFSKYSASRQDSNISQEKVGKLKKLSSEVSKKINYQTDLEAAFGIFYQLFNFADEVQGAVEKNLSGSKERLDMLFSTEERLVLGSENLEMLRSIMSRGLSSNVEERFQNARDILEKLRAIRTSLDIIPSSQQAVKILSKNDSQMPQQNVQNAISSKELRESSLNPGALKARRLPIVGATSTKIATGPLYTSENVAAQNIVPFLDVKQNRQSVSLMEQMA